LVISFAASGRYTRSEKVRMGGGVKQRPVAGGIRKRKGGHRRRFQAGGSRAGGSEKAKGESSWKDVTVPALGTEKEKKIKKANKRRG